jgi:hypothetical protein
MQTTNKGAAPMSIPNVATLNGGMTITYSQPDQRFRGPAYNYIRASDQLPTYEQIADVKDPLCKVKLFLAGSRFTYYVAAVTDYDGMYVLSGYCVSPLEPSYDAFEDASLQEIAGVRVGGIPLERDLHFHPLHLKALQALITGGRRP